ncbi:zinc finger BED domain-containing protein RICESLEEPER 2-like protein [Tanacetum coccineum]
MLQDANNNSSLKLGANGSNSNNQPQTADLGDEHQFKKRKIACKSKVWIDMIKIDNDTRAQCINCKECYVIPNTGTTTTLARHLKNCHQKKDADRKQQLLNFQRVSDEDTSSSFPVLATGGYKISSTLGMICGLTRGNVLVRCGGAYLLRLLLIKKLRFLSILLCRSPSSSPSVYFFADLLAPHLSSRINDAVPAQGNSKVENRMTFIIFMLQRYSMEGSGDENGNGMDHQYCGMHFLHLNLSNKLSVPVLNGEQITLHSGYKHMDYYEKTLRLHSARIVVMDNGHVA